MTVLITLTIAGTDSGPFDLYSNVDGYVSAFETGVSKAALLAGYSSALVPNGTTTIRIKSTGTCTNYIDVPVTTTTTTTSTPPPPSTTTTTTTIMYVDYLADKYDCSTCTVVTPNVLVSLPSTAVPNYGKFYVPSAGTGEQGLYSYNLLLSTTGGPGLILDDLSFTLCVDACNVIP